jgi:hypothetical protein
MANLMNTELGAMLKRAKMLKHTLVWQLVFLDKPFKIQILNWIKLDQLESKGIDEDGDIIGLYSAMTERLNPEKIEGTPFTLNDTGEFYDSMIITVLKDSIIIDADSIKVDESGGKTDLFQKYGDGIIGLTDENKNKLADEILERYKKETKKLLFNY